MSQPIPPVAVLISHRVADYTTWKKAFDADQPARREASCLGHHINRGADDPNMIHVYSPATDAAKLKAFMTSPKLPETMKQAGVQGVPTVTWMKPMSADFIQDRLLPGAIVSHAVEDYGKWRPVYDELDGFRKRSGIIGHAVNQELGAPHRVTVYHQAEALATLRAFADSPELKTAMKRSGVVGAPDIRFVEVTDFANY
jgi:quinol monooxygenase YgiN